MKTIAAELAYFVRGQARRNLRLLLGYVVFVLALILVYALVFDYLMLRLEGRRFSLITGIYWTITVMTTLGFGDITFHTDGGRVFSGIVTLSGIVFLLILLPFGMISLFLAPWLEERLRYRPPDRIPDGMSDHVLLVGWDAVTKDLVGSLSPRGTPYAVLTDDLEDATGLDQSGVPVVYGIPTDEDTLDSAGVCRARSLVANLSDTDNANLVLTVRRLCDIPIVALLDESERVKFLELAGATRVVPLKYLLGRHLAVRSTTQGAFAHVVDSYGNLNFAEIPAYATPFAGKTVEEARLREKTGVTVIGIWERGAFELASPSTVIDEGSVVLFAGDADQLRALELLVEERGEDDFVLILGYGAVGRSAAEFLRERDVRYRVVDLEDPAKLGHEEEHLIQGDASHREVLEAAGINDALGLIVTTNDDGTNVFLTLVARNVSPHGRIVSRANREENVDELYAAGADFVVSVASVGGNILLNALEGKETVFLSEGIHIFVQPVGRKMVGRHLADLRIATRTGATVVGLQAAGTGDGLVPVTAETVLEEGQTVVMVGSPESEARFTELFRG